ncbi:MAG TPA: hypothetical protein VK419_12425 [Bryobacteraceae bacterium]|nr:hypothetical protein [Bryobacteraceae bacterium]
MHRYILIIVRITLICLLLALCACSSETPPAKSSGAAPPPGVSVATNKHPLAKYIELVGFRMAESGAGKLKITFGVVNHSDADVGDLGLKIILTTSAAKPDEPPIAEFDVKVPDLGPKENKDVSAVVPTKLRIYELPDWQFLRAKFEITSPAPGQ